MKLFKNLFSPSEQDNDLSHSQQIVKKSKEVLMPLFEPQEVVPERAEGCYIYDLDGNKYLDFAAGIAVNALGHNHPAHSKALKEQIDKIIHIPGTFLTEPKIQAAALLTENSCFDQVFFCNSGTEAIEGAFKLARKWAYETKGEQANEVIAFENAFHGRSMGAASLTNKRSTQPFYAPYIEGIHFATYNDIESIKTLISDKTAAILVEPVQGEGGIVPADLEFLKQLREICDANKIALVFDEIQAGIGRLGTFFAYEKFGIEPDIAALAKGLGGGFPIGAIVAKKSFGDHFNAGAHGSTYGGNPLGTAAASAVLSEILKPGFLPHVNEMSDMMFAGLEKIKKDTGKITDIRGMGLMIGVDAEADAKALRPLLQNTGLMTTGAGKRTLRLTPPLIITKDHIDEAMAILENVIKNA